MVVRYGIILFLNLFISNNKKELIQEESHKEKYQNKIFSYLKNTSLVTISAQIIIFPIIAYNYKTISFTFILTNILTSYLIGIIIITGFALVIISFISLNLADFLGKPYKLIIDLLLFITENTAKLPLSKIYIKAPYLWGIVLYYVFIFLLYCLYKKYRKEKNNSKVNTNI